MRAFFLVVALLIATNASQAAELDIKGLKPGMSLEQIKELFPDFHCIEADTTDADMVCDAPRYYAGANSEISVFLLDNKVMIIIVTFESGSFDDVISALKEKFGKPALILKNPVQNMMGATFVNHSILWIKGDKHLTAKRYDSKITESSVMLSSVSSLNRLEKGRKRDVERRATGL